MLVAPFHLVMTFLREAQGVPFAEMTNRKGGIVLLESRIVRLSLLCTFTNTHDPYQESSNN